MKKLTSFLCVLSLAGTTSLMAQNDAQANLLSNPGFEDTEFQTFSYDNNSVKNCISYVAGWDATNKPGDAEYKKDDYNWTRSGWKRAIHSLQVPMLRKPL